MGGVEECAGRDKLCGGRGGGEWWEWWRCVGVVEDCGGRVRCVVVGVEESGGSGGGVWEW